MQQCTLPFLLMNQPHILYRCPKCSKDDVYLLPSKLAVEPEWHCQCLDWTCGYYGKIDEFLVITSNKEEENKNKKEDTSNY